MGRRYRKKRNMKPVTQPQKKSVATNRGSLPPPPKIEVCVATRVPAEVWEIIAGNLDTSQDLHSLSQAVPVCADFLHQTKTEWLMDQVLPIVVVNNLALLGRQDVLNCRVVCKKWLGAVDMLYKTKTTLPKNLRDAIVKNQMSESLGFQRWLANCGYLADEMKPEKMLEILQHPENLSSSPIFARYLELRLRTDEENELIRMFLHKFGRHVWYIDLYCGPTAGVQIFKDLVRYTPYLKNIGIFTFTPDLEINCRMTRSIKGMTRNIDNFLKSDLCPLKEPILEL